MKRCTLFLALGLAGCTTLPACPEPLVTRYHNPAFPWPQVARVVVLPIVNETAHPQASEEVRRSLHAELQQVGTFETVLAPVEQFTERTSRCLRDSGRFSEAEMVGLARHGGADVILLGTLTHYSPYQRPRIGLTLQAISPDMGQVVASVDGLWDANEIDVADRARAFYEREKSIKQRLNDHVRLKWDEDYSVELVLKSPHLYQRFVTGEAARILLGVPTTKPKVEEPPYCNIDVAAIWAWCKDCARDCYAACCWWKKGDCPPAAEKKDAEKKDADKPAAKPDKEPKKEARGEDKKKADNAPPAAAKKVLPPPERDQPL